MAISGRETQSSFLPPMTSSVSILHHHGHTPAPRSFAFGRSFSRNNHRDRNFRNTRSLPSSFFSNLTLDALPWNIVFITHLLTIFLVVGTSLRFACLNFSRLTPLSVTSRRHLPDHAPPTRRALHSSIGRSLQTHFRPALPRPDLYSLPLPNNRRPHHRLHPSPPRPPFAIRVKAYPCLRLR